MAFAASQLFERPLRSQKPGRFAPVLEPGTNILRLERSFAPEVAEALAQVAASPRFETHARLDLTHLDPAELLEPVSNQLARQFLAEDIKSLARDFGNALGRVHLHAQLVVMTHDGCRKLHADNVTMRLLCTYAGPGTQWLADEHVVRNNLARVDVDVETANRSVVRAPGRVQTCDTADIVLLKGEAFEGNRGRGAVHRSPPIEAEGLRRLVFKIDENRCGC